MRRIIKSCITVILVGLLFVMSVGTIAYANGVTNFSMYGPGSEYTAPPYTITEAEDLTIWLSEGGALDDGAYILVNNCKIGSFEPGDGGTSATISLEPGTYEIKFIHTHDSTGGTSPFSYSLETNPHSGLFNYPCINGAQSEVVDLIADGGSPATAIDIGDVEIWDDGANLYVKYIVTEPNWVITSAKFHVADNPGDIPQNKSGNPKVGKFDYNEPLSSGVTEFTSDPIDISGMSSPIYVAAHAEAYYDDSEITLSETAWGDGTDFSGKNWATYIEYEITGGVNLDVILTGPGTYLDYISPYAQYTIYVYNLSNNPATDVSLSLLWSEIVTFTYLELDTIPQTTPIPPEVSSFKWSGFSLAPGEGKFMMCTVEVGSTTTRDVTLDAEATSAEGDFDPSNNQDSNTFTMQADLDLDVEDIWSQTNPLVAGHLEDVSVRIRNNGPGTVAIPYEVLLLFDGSPIASVVAMTPLGPSAFEEFSFIITWPSDTDPHNVSVVVDSTNVVWENDEANNQRTEIWVGSLPG